MIEKAGDSVNNGGKISKDVMELQIKAGDMSQKVGTLLDEVNRAAKEELKGANQITKAVSQINTVVQQTASSSEETAAAGEELLSQAEMLKRVVVELNDLVKGAGARINGYGKENKNSDALSRREKTTQLLESSHKPREEIRSLQLTHKDEGVEIIKPEDKIPLNDFKDF